MRPFCAFRMQAGRLTVCPRTPGVFGFFCGGADEPAGLVRRFAPVAARSCALLLLTRSAPPLACSRPNAKSGSATLK